MHGLEEAYWGRVDFVYIDRENPANEVILKKYDNRAQPEFILIAPDGAEVRRWIGAPGEDELREALDSYLAQR